MGWHEGDMMQISDDKTAMKTKMVAPPYSTYSAPAPPDNVTDIGNKNRIFKLENWPKKNMVKKKIHADLLFQSSKISN